MGSSVSSVPRPRPVSARRFDGVGIEEPLVPRPPPGKGYAGVAGRPATAGVGGTPAATATPAAEPSEDDTHYAAMLGLLTMEEEFWTHRASTVKAGYFSEQKKLKEARSVFVSAQGVSDESDNRDEALRMGADQLYQALTAKPSCEEDGDDASSNGLDGSETTDGRDVHDTTVAQRMNDDDMVALDVPPAPAPPPPTPAPDMPMDSIPPGYYASPMAPLGLRPKTLPLSKPLHLTIPNHVVEEYPPTLSIGLSEGDVDMGLVVDRMAVADVLGGLPVLRALAKEFVSRLLASGCRCPGLQDADAAAETFFNWFTARLGGDAASPMHALSSFAQIAMLHSSATITAPRADLWLECILGAMATVLPHYSQAEAMNWAHMGLHQLFHLLSKGMVNDITPVERG